MDNSELKKEYFFKGNKTGCLLIHGFTSTPAELRELGENLMKEGYTVLGIQLKGHGTTVEDMIKSNYQDWLNSSIDGYNLLRVDCDKIYVIGHSMGSLLSMYLAENFHVNKLVTLAPPLVTKNKAANYAHIIKYFVKYVEWPHKERPSEESKYLLGYKRIPMKSIADFNKLSSIIKKDLCKITSPILIMYSHNDDTVDNTSVNLMTAKIKSTIIETICLEESGHNITVENEKQEVFRSIINFLN